jgi:probable F420-dependent oxidoreductase
VTTLSIGVPNYGPTFATRGWTSLVTLAQQIEAAGFDRLIVVDHVVMGPNTDAYQWGSFPVPPDAPWCEPLTVLAAIAPATTRLRLSTGILIAPLRPAALLAKTVATLDVLSGGRLDLGVGTGWQREEYEAMGLSFEARGRLLTETIAACRALWEQSPASFASESVSFDGIWCAPVPAQERLPVWFSGTLNERVLRRVVELGDGWIPIMGATIEQIADGAKWLRAAWREAGRSGDPEVRIPLPVVRGDDRRVDLDATMAQIPELVDAGATDVHVTMQVFVRGDELGRAPEILGEVADTFARADPRR